MGCMSGCAKYFLCFFNFAFFVAGGAAFSVGIWLIADSNSFIKLIAQVDQEQILTNTNPDVLKVIAYILIAVGALTVVVSFLGYCGAMFESRCLLGVYGILILIVVVLQCVVIGLAFGLKRDADGIAQNILKSTIKFYNDKSAEKNDVITKFWDTTMANMHCCGVKSRDDWRDELKPIPAACCILKNGEPDNTCRNNPNSSNTYDQGCYLAIGHSIKDNLVITIGVGLGLLFVELLVIVLALYLACCYWRPHHDR